MDCAPLQDSLDRIEVVTYRINSYTDLPDPNYIIGAQSGHAIETNEMFLSSFNNSYT